MKTNAAGIALIKKFEGLRLKAYQDQGGKWTIGWGHTNGVHPDMVIDEAQAEALFTKDLGFVEWIVNRYITVPVTSNQFSALVSFAFNLGVGKFGISTLLKRLLEGDTQGAADQILRWDKARDLDGVLQTDEGLARRRTAERELFLTPDGT